MDKSPTRPDIPSLRLWSTCGALESSHEPEVLDRARKTLYNWGISEEDAWALFRERFDDTTTMEMV